MKVEDKRGYQRLAIDKKKKNLQALYNFNLLNEGLVMLKKIAAEFELNEKLCFIDKTAFTEVEWEQLEAPLHYNTKVQLALDALDKQLPTFAVLDDGLQPTQKFCLLIERGSFWGMGYLPATHKITSSLELKNHLDPYTDNDTIRNSIYSFVAQHPGKKILFTL